MGDTMLGCDIAWAIDASPLNLRILDEKEVSASNISMRNNYFPVPIEGYELGTKQFFANKRHVDHLDRVLFRIPSHDYASCMSAT